MIYIYILEIYYKINNVINILNKLQIIYKMHVLNDYLYVKE